jgi:GNAT superfamily N-acetyltransferase/preprotein translocase subunit Sec61beta
MSTYQPIQKEDIEDLVKLFNEVYSYDKISPELMHEKIYDEESFLKDANFKVIKDGELKAFATGYIRFYEGKNTGWIKLMAAEDQNQLGPIMQQSFDKIENILIDHGAELIRFFDSFPNYYRPGIDPRYTAYVTLLHKKGYKKRRDNVNMIADLKGQDFNTEGEEKELEKSENILIKRATVDDHDLILDFMETAFPVWIKEFEKTYQIDPIPLHIALKNDKVIAFSAHNCNNMGTGWFGPMGTSEEARGKGIGAILLKRCLKDIKESGLDQSIIPWVGPIGFYYEKVGAEVSRVFWNYSKEIKE